MFRFDKNNLVILLVLLAIFSLSRGEFDLQGTLMMLPGLILALTFHEYAHARTADKLGDPTPESQGRLTLNPMAHMDVAGTICLLFAGFGWGKPVQVNGSYFREPAKDNMKVALAGPVMNFILAFVLFVILAIITYFTPESVLLNSSSMRIWSIVYQIVLYAAMLNVSLGVFNLLPVPPLDGSKIFAYFLKGKAREFIYTLERYSWIIISILFITNIASYIVTPLVNWITEGMLFVISLIFGLFIK
ncbi:MAG: site-2 protease family protein [Clostridia bacterium]|nr:site-2 protease family protein [Clostridia bacterium]